MKVSVIKLKEFRWLLLFSLGTIFTTSLLGYIFSKQILTILLKPWPHDLKVNILSYSYGILTYVKISLYFGIILSLPIIAGKCWKSFIKKLQKYEKKLFRKIIFFTVLSFIASISFTYFIILPPGLNFLLDLQTDFGNIHINIDDYINFVFTLFFLVTIAFKFPVLSFFLFKIGVITSHLLVKYHRFGLYLIFLLSAVLTPPDVITQLLLLFPMILFYQISIWSPIVLKVNPIRETVNESKLKEIRTIILIIVGLFATVLLLLVFLVGIPGKIEIIVILLSIPVIERMHVIIVIFIKNVNSGFLSLFCPFYAPYFVFKNSYKLFDNKFYWKILAGLWIIMDFLILSSFAYKSMK